MTVVEREEAVGRELGTKIVVLSGKHLLTHSVSKLGGEVENGTETQVTSLTTLVVLDVLDATPTTESSHTGIDIFVQVETLCALETPPRVVMKIVLRKSG